MPYGPDGFAIGPAGEGVVSRERGALAAEAGVVLVRSGLAVQARADHHEVGLDRGERVVVETEALHRTRREVLGDRVGPLDDEPPHELDRSGLLEVEREVALADVEAVVHRRALEPVRVARVGERHRRAGSRVASSTRCAARSRRARRSSASRSAPPRPNRTRGSCRPSHACVPGAPTRRRHGWRATGDDGCRVARAGRRGFAVGGAHDDERPRETARRRRPDRRSRATRAAPTRRSRAASWSARASGSSRTRCRRALASCAGEVHADRGPRSPASSSSVAVFWLNVGPSRALGQPSAATSFVISSRLATRALPPRRPNDTKPSRVGQISRVRPMLAPRREPAEAGLREPRRRRPCSRRARPPASTSRRMI